jgi:hypothetical protein
MYSSRRTFENKWPDIACGRVGRSESFLFGYEADLGKLTAAAGNKAMYTI